MSNVQRGPLNRARTVESLEEFVARYGTTISVGDRVEAPKGATCVQVGSGGFGPFDVFPGARGSVVAIADPEPNRFGILRVQVRFDGRPVAVVPVAVLRVLSVVDAIAGLDRKLDV